MLRTLSHHWRRSVTGAGLLLLAGCAGHYLVQREPWRKDAELACLQSGAVKESGTIVRVEPINGPGMCGADFPLKVAALGDQPLLGYSDLRPPGDVPGVGSAALAGHHGSCTAGDAASAIHPRPGGRRSRR